VGFIALAFVFVFGQPSRTGNLNVVAEVNGEPINRDSFEFFRDQLERAQRQRMPAPPTDDAAFNQQLDLLAMAEVMRRHIMAQEAQAIGLRVTDTEIAEEICRQPGFQRDGRCDTELLEQFIARSFDSERSYTDELRRDLLNRKLVRLITSPVRVSDTTVGERLRREQLELRLRYAAIHSDAFIDRVEVSPEAAAELAAAEPERVAAAYERRRSEFVQPESVRARHILFSGDNALERAQAVLARVEAGEDFVALATELSEDEASRELGGDLGTFPRGRMLPAFEEAAFAADPRTTVGPIETEHGQHLIRVEEHIPAVERTLDQVSVELATDLIRQDRAQERAREAAEALSAAIRDGQSLQEAAAEQEVAVEETVLFRAAEPVVPGIGHVPGMRETATSLTLEEPDSTRIFGSGRAFYLISLAERREVDPETLTTELAPTRERMLREARDQVLSEWYRQRRAALDAEGRVQRFPLYAN
jgi:peptidyl-prolyl cis-trans isomerase D